MLLFEILKYQIFNSRLNNWDLSEPGLVWRLRAAQWVAVYCVSWPRCAPLWPVSGLCTPAPHQFCKLAWIWSAATLWSLLVFRHRFTFNNQALLTTITAIEFIFFQILFTTELYLFNLFRGEQRNKDLFSQIYPFNLDWSREGFKLFEVYFMSIIRTILHHIQQNKFYIVCTKC